MGLLDTLRGFLGRSFPTIFPNWGLTPPQQGQAVVTVAEMKPDGNPPQMPVPNVTQQQKVEQEVIVIGTNPIAVSNTVKAIRQEPVVIDTRVPMRLSQSEYELGERIIMRVYDYKQLTLPEFTRAVRSPDIREMKKYRLSKDGFHAVSSAHLNNIYNYYMQGGR